MIKSKLRRSKKSKFTSIEPKSPLWARTIDAVWIGLFWAIMIIIAEKGKWIAAKVIGDNGWIGLIVAGIAIIFFEVLKYVGAKRLYKLFPWLGKFINNHRR